jgi:hypothetical protein
LSVKKRQHATAAAAPSAAIDAVRVERTRASIKFIDQAKGTLPEVVSERDLETLNAGLRFFFADLRHAFELYQRSEGHGRAGAVKALSAAWRFIALFSHPLADNLHVPILQLLDALAALDDNNIDPMLAPVPHRGRAKSTGRRATLKGQAAGTVIRLISAGMTPLQAYGQVAATLVKFGVRRERGSARQITATTVRHWCDNVVADVGRHGVASMVCHDMFTPEENERFASLPTREKQRSFALTSLTDFLRAVFPQQKPT